MKKPILFLLCFLVCFVAWAGELEHIFRDAGGWDLSINDTGECFEEKHLFIKLSEGDWNVICGGDKDFRRDYASWYGEICIKCRRIDISCSGNDIFRYILIVKEKDEKLYKCPNCLKDFPMHTWHNCGDVTRIK